MRQNYSTATQGTGAKESIKSIKTLHDKTGGSSSDCDRTNILRETGCAIASAENSGKHTANSFGSDSTVDCMSWWWR